MPDLQLSSTGNTCPPVQSTAHAFSSDPCLQYPSQDQFMDQFSGRNAALAETANGSFAGDAAMRTDAAGTPAVEGVCVWRHVWGGVVRIESAAMLRQCSPFPKRAFLLWPLCEARVGPAC